jgi:hypothetical protein
LVLIPCFCGKPKYEKTQIYRKKYTTTFNISISRATSDSRRASNARWPAINFTETFRYVLSKHGVLDDLLYEFREFPYPILEVA